MKPQYSEDFLAKELFDVLPESVFWFKPIYTNDTVTDFKVGYCNKAASAFLNTSRENIVGNKILTNNVIDQEYKNLLFDQCLQVLSSGKQHEESFYSKHLGKYFSVIRSKALNGVLSVSRDYTEKFIQEQEKQNQNEFLESVLNASINGVFVCDAVRNNENTIVDFRFIKINKAFAEMIGKNEEEVLGKNYLSLFPSAVKNGMIDLNAHVVESCESIRKEVYYNGDGINAWFDVSLLKLEDNGLVVTFTDITKSKQHINSLKKYASQLNTIINTSQSGIFTCKPVFENNEIVDFRFTMANKVLANYVNEEPENLIGGLGTKLFARYKENGLYDVFKNTYTTGETARLDFCYQGNNTSAWVDLLATKLDDEVLVTFNDFTHIKNLQLQLEQSIEDLKESNKRLEQYKLNAEKSADKLKTVINTSLAGMFTISPIYDDKSDVVDFKFEIVNEAVAAYIGQTAQVLTGSLASIYFPAYKTNGLFEIYKDTLLSGKSYLFDFHYEDGYDVYFNIHTIKAGDEVLVTFTDQTTLKKLQKQLEESIENLKLSNTNLEEFAYVASHDLQEPLRKIRFFAERIKSQYASALDETAKSMFQRLESATIRMKTLIEDLLSYSQVSRDKNEFEKIDLNQIVKYVISDLEPTILEKNAKLEVEKLPFVYGDARQLQQLFQNLLSNALKYNKHNRYPEIKINSKIVSETLNGSQTSFNLIQVEDNGIGFPQDQAEKIFQVFQRLHGRHEYSGTGIGLAIAQKVVLNHHGFIKAESEVDKGSVFKIYFPA